MWKTRKEECKSESAECLEGVKDWDLWATEDIDDVKPTNRKVKRRGVEQDHQREDIELEHGGHLTKGDEEKTDVFGDAHFLSDCFRFVSEDSAFVVEHITFMELQKDQGTDDDPSKREVTFHMEHGDLERKNADLKQLLVGGRKSWV